MTEKENSGTKSANRVAKKNDTVNILYLHPVSRWIGGGETGLLDFLAHLNRERFNPVVAIPHKGPLLDTLRDRGVKTYLISLRRWSAIETRLAMPVKLARLTRMIRREKIDLIHAHSHETTPFAVLASRYTNTPVISHIRIDISRREAKRYLVHLADTVLTKTGWQKEEISGITGAPVIKTGDGFAAGTLDIEERDTIRDRVRTELGIGKEALVVVCVTRFEERKNLELALEAISLVAEENIYLLLVGSRDEKDPYEKKIRLISTGEKLKGRVKIIPFAENRRDYLFAADIFLQPSKKEGLSRAAVEGMLSGLPLIATDIPGSRELIVAGENGYLIDPDKPQVLAEMIDFFAQNRGRLSEMGHHSRTRTMQDFDIAQYLAKIEEVYLKLSEKAKGEK